MEEKERYYSLIDNNGNFELRDYERGTEIYSIFELDELLNQQDKEIKTLKTKLEDRKRFCISQVKCQQNLINKLLEENTQLQQLQKQIIINVLEDIMICCRYGISDYWSLNYVCNVIENQIKKLKGGKNEKF